MELRHLKSFNELNERMEEEPSSREQHKIDREAQGSRQGSGSFKSNNEPKNDTKPSTNSYKEEVLATNGDLDELTTLMGKYSEDKEAMAEVYKTIITEYPDVMITQDTIDEPDAEESIKKIAMGKLLRDSIDIK